MWFVGLLAAAAVFLLITGATVYREPEPFVGAAVAGALAVAAYVYDRRQKDKAEARRVGGGGGGGGGGGVDSSGDDFRRPPHNEA